MFTKKVNRSLVFAVILFVILVFVFSCVLILGSKEQPYEILTKKFQVLIKEQYEIVYFEKQSGSSFKKHYEAKLKLSPNEYYTFLLDLEKAGYNINSPNSQGLYLEGFDNWIDDEKLVKVYYKGIVNTDFFGYGDRLYLDISITEASDGNYHVYMSR